MFFKRLVLGILQEGRPLPSFTEFASFMSLLAKVLFSKIRYKYLLASRCNFECFIRAVAYLFIYYQPNQNLQRALTKWRVK